MSEFSQLLHHSDENSLILGDELCSGTEIDSALAIFMTGLKHLSNNNKCSYIFASHFHKITEYESITKLLDEGTLCIKHMAVQYDKKTNTLKYDRKLKEGSGHNRYGLEVCLSILPETFTDEAFKLRSIISKEETSNKPSRYNPNKIKDIYCEICKRDNATEIHHLEAQKNFKNKYQTFHKNHSANLINICKICHRPITKDDTRMKKVKTNRGYIIEEIVE